MATRVFVRNIPYIATPDEIKEYLSKAGPVIDFLLKTDPETRKSKGHGFCEYANRASAELAIQQLNGKRFKGRELNISWPTGASRTPIRRGFTDAPSVAGQQSDIPVLPTEPLPGAAAAAAAAAKPEMTAEQLWYALQDIRSQTLQDPDRVATELQNNLQFAYALAEALALIGVIDPSQPQQILTERFAQAQALQQQQQQQQQPQYAMMPQQPQQMIPVPAAAAAAGAPIPIPMPGMVPVPMPMVPQPQQMVQPMQQNVTDAAAMEGMLAQVRSLSEEQIMQLPPGEREKIRQLLGQ